MKLIEANLEKFIYFVNEREDIRKKRFALQPKPWTGDPILQRHHFCNVHREDDRGTIELKNLATKLKVQEYQLPEYWTTARMFNHAPSTEVYWQRGVDALKLWRDEGNKVFNTAYVVSTCGRSMDKVEYVHEVVTVVRRGGISNLSCIEAFGDLREVDGLGSFMCGQIVADLKYTPYLEAAPDWHTFAVMGPGSQKGLNLIFGAGTTEKSFEPRITELSHLVQGQVPDMHRQDLQNCLCEFSKYMRYYHDMPGRRRNYK
jgi:hypothetical protein